MWQSLSAVYLHIVFSTKHRSPFLSDKDLRVQAHSYIGGVINGMKCNSLLVGGVEDHVHILLRHSRTETIAKLVGTIKANSTTWAKRARVPGFEWQSGYGAFSIGIREVEAIRRYIETQEDHHRKVNFQDEYRRILHDNEIAFDESYVWD